MSLRHIEDNDDDISMSTGINKAYGTNNCYKELSPLFFEMINEKEMENNFCFRFSLFGFSMGLILSL